jgi:hypothetical protein
MATSKKKKCERCRHTKFMEEFPDSAWAKDGKLKFCSVCWSKKMKKALAKRGAKKSKRKPVERSTLDTANEALKAANAKKRDQFLVRADDGDLAEFSNEDKALRQAMEWQMAGYAVTVWRQCQFEMVLRIIG